MHAGVGEHAQQERTFEEVPPGIYRMTVLQLSGTDGAMHEGHASSGGGRLRRQGPFVFECLSATHEWHAFQAQLLQQRPHNLIHPPEPGMHAHVQSASRDNESSVVGGSSAAVTAHVSDDACSTCMQGHENDNTSAVDAVQLTANTPLPNALPNGTLGTMHTSCAEAPTQANANAHSAVTCNGRSSGCSMDTTNNCLLYTSPSPRDRTRSRMPSSA